MPEIELTSSNRPLKIQRCRVSPVPSAAACLSSSFAAAPCHALAPSLPLPACSTAHPPLKCVKLRSSPAESDADNSAVALRSHASSGSADASTTALQQHISAPAGRSLDFPGDAQPLSARPDGMGAHFGMNLLRHSNAEFSSTRS